MYGLGIGTNDVKIHSLVLVEVKTFSVCETVLIMQLII